MCIRDRCRGVSSNLSAFGAASYTWSPSGSLTVDNLPNTIANPVMTTTYTVIGANGSCVASATLELVMVQTATAQINSVAAVCLGGSTSIEATGGSSYSWLPVTGLAKPNAASTMVYPDVYKRQLYTRLMEVLERVLQSLRQRLQLLPLR